MRGNPVFFRDKTLRAESKRGIVLDNLLGFIGVGCGWKRGAFYGLFHLQNVTN